MNSDSLQAQGLTRTTLALLFMAMLICASFWILHLFLTALIWASMIVVSTWPIMREVEVRLGGRRFMAATFMTAGLLMVFILPLSLAVMTIYAHTEDIVGAVRSLAAFSVPPPPAWIGTMPGIGKKLAEQWQHVVTIGPAGVSAFLEPYAGKALSWIASLSGSIGKMIVQFLLTVLISAIFYVRGDQAAAWLTLFAQRIAGPHGEFALTLAAKAIRAVALGVGGTALIQSLLAGLGLAVSGVPAAGILTAVMFMICLAQIGPLPVLVPAVIWLFWADHTAWGSAMAVWTLVIGTSDNFIRPFLMKKGADLPLLLICAGVTGGLLVFGIIGLFIGPVVLAVAYTLLDAWVVGNVPEGEEPVGP